MANPRYERRRALGLCGMCGVAAPREGKTNCADCAAYQHQRRRERGTVARRIEEYSRLYGLSPTDYERLLARGACWCCERPARRYDIDHDHAIGGKAGGADKARLRASVRGIVCHRCNLLVGQYEGGTLSGRWASTAEDRARVEAYLARPYPFAEAA